jgi:hypothetical protein
VSDQQNNNDPPYFDRVNRDLADSLRRCHALVHECRDKLAANSNHPEALSELESADEDGERVG